MVVLARVVVTGLMVVSSGVDEVVSDGSVVGAFVVRGVSVAAAEDSVELMVEVVRIIGLVMTSTGTLDIRGLLSL